MPIPKEPEEEQPQKTPAPIQPAAGDMQLDAQLEGVEASHLSTPSTQKKYVIKPQDVVRETGLCQDSLYPLDSIGLILTGLDDLSVFGGVEGAQKHVSDSIRRYPPVHYWERYDSSSCPLDESKDSASGQTTVERGKRREVRDENIADYDGLVDRMNERVKDGDMTISEMAGIYDELQRKVRGPVNATLLSPRVHAFMREQKGK